MSGNPAERLRKVLWLDAFLGLSFGIVGLNFLEAAAALLGFPLLLARLIALANLGYGLTAMILASRRQLSVSGAGKMVIANGIWAGISVVLCWQYFGLATLPGRLFLVGQIPVVGGLSLLEAHLVKAAQAFQNTTR